MARPLKKGLGYFPLDTDLYSDRKIQRLLRKYGCKGICIYLAILCEIYREKGYYISYDSDFCFDISVILGVGRGTVSEAVFYCIDLSCSTGNAGIPAGTFFAGDTETLPGDQ